MRSSSAVRSCDFARAEERLAASSAAQASTARATTTASSTASGVRSCARLLPPMNARATTSASSHACATISSAPSEPSATETNRNVRVARAYRSSLGSSALTAQS